MSENAITPLSSRGKPRSKKDTADKLKRAISSIEQSNSKLTISAVAKNVGVTASLIHNTYPDIAERIRSSAGKSVRGQRDAKHQLLTLERELNKALRAENKQLSSDLAKLASINQALIFELATLRGIASGKVIALIKSSAEHLSEI